MSTRAHVVRFSALLQVLCCLIATFVPISIAWSETMEVPDVAINEFMASNSETYFDEDGDSSDWIELRNTTDADIDISGWYLTDDEQDLRKWQFPSGMDPLTAGEFLVVFASDKNRRVAGSELHTNFKLSAGGEYLALVRDDGITVEHEYSPDFPPQMEDVSYGIGSEGVSVTLVSMTEGCEYKVPSSSSDMTNWHDGGSGWISASYGVGFDTAQTYLPYIDNDVADDLITSMYGENSTVLSRTTFTVSDPTAVSSLILEMRCDDGFVAYINGHEVASLYDPSSLDYDSAATGSRSDSTCLDWESYDLTSHISDLNAGSNTLSIHGLNRSDTSSDMLIQPRLTAVIDTGEAIDYRYFETPTPGTANASGKLGYVAPVEADYPHGYYDDPISVTLVSDTVDAEIRYTTDCSAPNAGSTLYSGPITVDSSMVIRAAAFKDGYDDAPSVTFTYIFPDDVINQSSDQSDRGFPAQWIAGAGGSGIYDREIRTADYEMDPNITSDVRLLDGLYSLPVVSLVGDMDDFFDSDTGIYTNSIQRAGSNIFWERAASLEMFDPLGDLDGFSVNAGMRITGELARWVAVNDKQSLRIVFRTEYGPTKLDTELLGDEVERFDTIILRSHWGQSFLNDEVRGDEIGVSFANGDPTRTTYIRDLYGHDAHRDVSKLDARGRFVHLYLNGIYWGMYEFIERPDNSFNAEHRGGDKDDYDVIKGGIGATGTNGFLQDGQRDAYNQLFTYFNASSSGSNYSSVTPTSDAVLAQVEQYLDVDAYIDYMVTLWHMCRLDFPRKNWYCAARRDPNNPSGPPLEKFRYYVWDNEAAMWSVDSSSQADRWNDTDTSNDTGPVRIYRRIRQNAKFQRRWADRVQELMFNGGALTPEKSIARFRKRREEIDTAIIAESARWGDWAELHHDDPMTRDNQWTTECDRLENDYFANRREYVLDQMAAVNLWPGFLAPVFSQHGGAVASDFELEMTNPNESGDIYYTLDGTDPRDSSTRQLYSGPVAIGAMGYVEVNACIMLSGEWSANNHASFVAFGNGGLVVSEIMYNPPAGGDAGGSYLSEDYEYIEILNNTDANIDLTDISISGDVEYSFPNGTIIQAHDYLLVASNKMAIIERYGPMWMTNHLFTGNMANGDGRVTIEGADGIVIFTVKYEDGGAWPGRADGTGSSLELVDPLADPSDPDNWRNSAEYLGTPGWAGAGAVKDIIVNEVLTHTDEPLVDYIELYNTTDSTIDISGWYLSDSASTLKKFRIPDGTTIAAGGYALFDEGDFNSSSLNTDFGLSSAHGDDVWLMEADSSGDLIRFVEHADFGAAFNGVSLGRWPNGTSGGQYYPMSYPTAGLANSGPRASDVIINEIAYNIEDNGDLEFIELYNRSGNDVDLTGWAIGGGVDYDFPVGSIIEADQRIIVIAFNPDNPVNAQRLADFVSYYGLGSEVDVYGGYNGWLNNAGERVTLYAADEPPLEEPYFTPQPMVETVSYDELAPWPTTADNGGDSLVRAVPVSWCDTASAWTAAAPTPGDSSGQVLLGDANGDGEVNLDDFIILKQNYGTSPATVNMGDFNGDGEVNLDDFIILKQNYGSSLN